MPKDFLEIIKIMKLKCIIERVCDQGRETGDFKPLNMQISSDSQVILIGL